ncbi:MAG: septum site-determining protein MinC [Chloroflexota bacterium]
MADEALSIKGIREGLLLTIKPDVGEWPEIATKVAERIDEQRAFFKGARMALDVGSRIVRHDELDSMKAVLTNREITLWAVISSSETTLTAARNFGLETTLITHNDEQLETTPVNPEEAGLPGIVIARTLRNGRSVRNNGHVIIHGDVNPGAEIIAGGSVFVWGKLRGNVHAGANGDETAVVCALDLAPTQLRIAGYVTVSPEDKRRKPRPEIASVREGRIVAIAWND